MNNGEATTITRWDSQGRLTAELNVGPKGQSGVLLSWYEHGTKRSETIYQDNVIIRKIQWDEDGNEIDE